MSIQPNLIYEAETMEQDETCCGGCMEIHKGISFLGLVSILKSAFVITSGSVMVYNDNFLGFYVIGLNCVFLLQSYWYMSWFFDDNLETRANVRFGFFLVLLYHIFIFTALFVIILVVPYEYYPNSV